MINLKIDPEFQSQIPPLTDDEFNQLEENILREGKLLSPLIVWNNTLVDGHNRYEIVQEHPEISFSTMPLPFESREDVLAWICKNQLGRRNLTPEQKKFLIEKQYSVEHRKPGGNGNNQYLYICVDRFQLPPQVRDVGPDSVILCTAIRVPDIFQKLPGRKYLSRILHQKQHALVLFIRQLVAAARCGQGERTRVQCGVATGQQMRLLDFRFAGQYPYTSQKFPQIKRLGQVVVYSCV